MRKLFRKWIDYRTIRKSNLFDPVYYLHNNPDVRHSDVDPLRHFLEHGWQEGRNPSPDFDIRYYLETNPDVKNAGINPLVHYLKYGQQEGRARTQMESLSKVVIGAEGNGSAHSEHSGSEKNIEISDILDLLHLEAHLPILSLEVPIDLLIPVYNGREFLDGLLSSIVKNTSLPYRLLLANDKSSDPLMSGYLKEFKKDHPEVNVTILENEENLGFVKTVNQLAALTQNHFVILNTDTEVPPHWLERLMYPILTHENIASTTPFSNAGVICSFPNFLEDNPMFEDMDLEILDSFFQYVNPEKTDVEVPTGVGFCMGINKNVYDRIGMFDEVFGKGYGEENDWCMRAMEAGYKNIIAPNLFIYHKHGGSFPSEEKKQLSEKNLELLGIMHPDYFSRVADFIQRDPLKDLRTLLKIKILSQAGKPRIILDHALRGGANMYSKMLISKENLSAVITPGNKAFGNYVVSFSGQKMETVSFEMRNIRDVEQISEHFNIGEVILNELIGYPKPKILELVDFLVKLKKDNDQIDFTYIVHDYFGVCPIYTLLDYTIKYCGVPSDLSYCDKCLQLNPLLNVVVPFVQKDYPTLTMTRWRDKFGELLNYSSRIVCFSQSSKEIFQKAYPDLPDEKIEVIPTVDWVRPVLIHKTSDQLNIAIVGHLEVQKGAHIVASLATYVDYYNLNIRFHVFGEIFEPGESFGFLKTLVKHGGFTRTDLPRLMEDNEIDLVLIPSICPETFSYTTEEAMKMGLPVAVFNFGAPAERVQLYEKGIVFQHQDPGYMIETIYQFFNKTNAVRTPGKHDLVFVCVSRDDLVYTRGVLSSAYMTEHRILKYDNRETTVPIPTRYNQAIAQLLMENYSGWIFFVHSDFSLLESVDPILTSLDHARLYGPIGAILEGGEKKLVGQILQGHNGGLIYYGSKVDRPTLVDTVDCQGLLIHMDLLRTYELRFDEHERLSFQQYVEEFCIQANVKYAIQTYVVPVQCKHASWRTLNRPYDLAIDYIHAKYPNKKWAGTCTHLS
jgi:GT2 family glycosyltransferase